MGQVVITTGPYLLLGFFSTLCTVTLYFFFLREAWVEPGMTCNTEYLLAARWRKGRAQFVISSFLLSKGKLFCEGTVNRSRGNRRYNGSQHTLHRRGYPYSLLPTPNPHPSSHLFFLSMLLREWREPHCELRIGKLELRWGGGRVRRGVYRSLNKVIRYIWNK